MKKFSLLFMVVGGFIVGLTALILTALGNPPNMGFCVACFERDIMGALGFHRAAPVQYLRPEIMGIVIGALAAAFAAKEFKAKSGSSPALRFFLGMLVMIGALVFLGCPLRMTLRLGGGDLNALVALGGFIVGIGAAVMFLKKGFNLGKAADSRRSDAWVFPLIMVILLIFVFAQPIFNPGTPVMSQGKPVIVDGKPLTGAPGPIFATKTPPTEPKPFPGAMHATVLASLLGGLVVGAIAQRTRLCFVGGIRDLMLMRDTQLLSGFLAILVTVLVGNIVLGKFNLGFEGQPIAHTEHLWNFLGMGLVGFASVLLGGCPLRQLVLAGSGNTDSAMTVFGMMVGAAVSHNFVLAAGKLPATGVMGVPGYGQYAVILGLVIAIGFALFNSDLAREPAAEPIPKAA